MKCQYLMGHTASAGVTLTLLLQTTSICKGKVPREFKRKWQALLITTYVQLCIDLIINSPNNPYLIKRPLYAKITTYFCLQALEMCSLGWLEASSLNEKLVISV